MGIPRELGELGVVSDRSPDPSGALGEAQGLPLAFALVVVLLHALCCVVQCAFTGGGDKEGAHDVAKMEAREALRDISADGGGGGALVS